jgi:hypothetical protein
VRKFFREGYYGPALALYAIGASILLALAW